MDARNAESGDLNLTPDAILLPAEIPGRKGKVPHLVRLIVREAHVKLGHTGVSTTLSEIRRTVWILRGRQVVKKVLGACVVCNRVQRQPYEQPTAPLPRDRCTATRPFEVTGVDFAGPLYLRKPENKAWFVMFTCASTRAVHTELVSSLSTPVFIMAFERFIGRWGQCRVIYSDNEKTFQCAARTLREIWRRAREFAAQREIAWRFIAEGAPWWGGFWERMIGTTKRLIKKMVGTARLTGEEMQTVLVKADAAINRRPITYQYDSHREPRPLCPTDMLIGPVETELPADLTVVDLTRAQAIRRTRYVEKLGQEFKQKWIASYLNERAKHFERRRRVQEIRLGEVVLIQADNVKRQEWKMGVIIEAIPSVDGIVRDVHLRTTSGILRRPIQRLCALELNENDDEDDDLPPPDDEDESSSDDEPDEPPNDDQLQNDPAQNEPEPDGDGEEIDAAAAIPLDNNIIENEEPQPAAADPRPPANDPELLQDDVPQGGV